jgi:predicted TIM-barrel fold metal-dependent hydrolase
MQSDLSCPCSSSSNRARLHAGEGNFADPACVVDVHHHFEPTGKNVDGTAWTIGMALDEMDRNGVTTAIGYAGPLFPDDVQSGRKKSREINEWSMQLCRAHPGRFGLFASLPLSDVAGSLTEIAYVFDVLGADGIGLATHYDGRGLGDLAFRPIFEELNRRKAVVYVHPAKAPGVTASSLSYESDLISAPWIEFPTNTARTILSLWTAGITRTLPDLRFIFCHGGGIMPILLGRIAGFSGWKTVGPDRLHEVFPDGIYAEFGKFYFELAQAYAPETVEMLLKIVPHSHLLYGSDFSYFPIAHSADLFGDLQLPVELNAQISGRNAFALLPKLASTGPSR